MAGTTCAVLPHRLTCLFTPALSEIKLSDQDNSYQDQFVGTSVNSAGLSFLTFTHSKHYVISNILYKVYFISFYPFAPVGSSWIERRSVYKWSCDDSKAFSRASLGQHETASPFEKSHRSTSGEFKFSSNADNKIHLQNFAV